MIDDATDVYRRLQQHLDRMPVGFPATESGVELRLLRRLFSPDEAAVALALSAVPEPVGRIAGRLPPGARGTAGATLDAMAARGVIFGSGREGRRRYSRAPLAIGIYEMQVDRLTAETQRDFEQYAREAFGRAFLRGGTTQMRTIPVSAAFVPDRLVGRYDDARSLVETGAGPWAVLNCVCRQGKDLLGEPCRQTTARRVCLATGRVARRMASTGTAEEVTRASVFGMLERAERDGMVLQPSNTRDPAFLCFCCGCCCGVLTIARQMPRPAEYLRTNYRVAVDASACADCGACVERCPMGALHTGEGTARPDLDRCIGCGACVGSCSSGALRLERRARTHAPPRDLATLYGRLTLERFGVAATARMAARVLARRQV